MLRKWASNTEYPHEWTHSHDLIMSIVLLEIIETFFELINSPLILIKKLDIISFANVITEYLHDMISTQFFIKNISSNIVINNSVRICTYISQKYFF